MKLLFIALNTIINIFLAFFYVLFWIILWNFLYWLSLSLLWQDIPAAEDPIHMRIAVLTGLSILVISVLFRKYLYLWVFEKYREYIFWKQKIVKTQKANIWNKTQNKNNEDDLEIYVNKEIK